ncbi:hypothetical protein Tco_1458738 [Tanacetum coccineum]
MQKHRIRDPSLLTQCHDDSTTLGFLRVVDERLLSGVGGLRPLEEVVREYQWILVMRAGWSLRFGGWGVEGCVGGGGMVGVLIGDRRRIRLGSEISTFPVGSGRSNRRLLFFGGSGRLCLVIVSVCLAFFLLPFCLWRYCSEAKVAYTLCYDSGTLIVVNLRSVLDSVNCPVVSLPRKVEMR